MRESGEALSLSPADAISGQRLRQEVFYYDVTLGTAALEIMQPAFMFELYKFKKQ